MKVQLLLEQVAARARNLETHARMVAHHSRDIERLEAQIQQHRSAIAAYNRCIREETSELNTLEYTIKTGHVPHRCTRTETTHCGGCRPDSGLDCMYDSLSVCETCGGVEGALLPVCPGRILTGDEHDANYAHYCAGTGPFVGRAR